MSAETTAVLTADGIRLGRTAADKADAITQCGQLLFELGAVEEAYLPAMHEREKAVSTFIGEEVAIPHGTDEARSFVRRTALGVIQYPDGVDWDGNRVTLCIAIAADGGRHVTLLAALAGVLQEPDQAEALRSATDVRTVLDLLTQDEEVSS